MNRLLRRASAALGQDRDTGTRGDERTLVLLLLLAMTSACGSDHGANTGQSGAAGVGGIVSGAGAGGSSGTSSGYSFSDPVVLVGDLTVTVRISQDDSSLYITNRGTVGGANGSVIRVPKAGGDAQSLADKREQPFGVAVQGGTVYWTEGTNTAGGVFALQPGQAPQALQANLALPQAVAVDSAHLAWSWGLPPASVVVKNLTDMTPVIELDGTYGSVSDLLFDNARNQIIVIDRGDYQQSANIEGRSFDGTQTSQILPAGISPVSLSAGAITGSRLLFTAPSEGLVRSIDLDNETPSVIAQGLNQPWGIAVDDQYFYVTERFSNPDTSCPASVGTLKAFPLAGGDPQLLAEGLACPSRIVVDSDAVYWVNNGIGDPPNGSVMKVEKRSR